MIIPEEQTCPKCGETKPIERFHKDKHRKCGRAKVCAVCANAYVLARRALNTERANRSAREWHARNREKSRAKCRAWYRKNREAQKARHAEWLEDNKRSVAESSRAWRKNNPERVREHARRNHINHPETGKATGLRYVARKKGAEVDGVFVTAEAIAARWAMWGDKCYMCGEKATSTDHVIPLAKNGLHVPANLRPSCKSCNSRKGAKWPYPISKQGA